MPPTDLKSGLLLYDKPAGVTSFAALFPLKREWGRNLGHTGTLDSFATGLLVVLIGKLTKLNSLLTDMDKVYEAEFTFGVETDTLDPTGQVVFEGAVPDQGVAEMASHWLGAQAQIPPEYSAVHVNGMRASDRIRRGESVEIAPRSIEIYALDVLRWSPPRLTVRIHCSKGTYVRSLARDWGRRVGCGAHVSALRRLTVGPFSLPNHGSEFLSPRQVWDQLGIPRLVVDDSTRRFLEQGKPLVSVVPPLDEIGASHAVLEAEDGQLVAVVERKGPWVYRWVEVRSAP